MSMLKEEDHLECFNACRTCGVFYLTSSSYLRQIFHPFDVRDDTISTEMMHIRVQLGAWNVEIGENDGYSQYICISCIHEFQKIFRFRRSCIDIQEEFRNAYKIQTENRVKIKTEISEPEEKNDHCVASDFIYVDDLSDTECDNSVVITPFNVSHIPIKEELYEDAAVPNEVFMNNIETACVAVKSSPSNNSATSQLGIILTEKSRNLAIQCQLCFYVALSEEDLNQHVQSVHKSKNLQCHICGKKFPDSTFSRLKFHLRWHKLSKHVKCVQCGFYCNSRDTLKQHTRLMHAKITCNFCCKSIPSKRMKRHIRVHAIECNLQCFDCQLVFGNKETRDDHFLEIHKFSASTSQQFNNPRCTQNNQMLMGNQELKLHIDHQRNFNKICHINMSDIGRSNTEDEYLHLTDEHQKTPTELNHNHTEVEENTRVTILNKNQEVIDKREMESNEEVFIDNQEEGHLALKVDTLKSFQQNSILCANCSQTFVTVEDLYTHNKEHVLSTRSIFKCHICEKSFDLKFSLNRHLKKHNIST